MNLRVLSSFGVFGLLVAGFSLVAVLTSGKQEMIIPQVSVVPISAVSPTLVTDVSLPRSAAVYDGLGAWVDSYDLDPVYVQNPTVTSKDPKEMVAVGVNTVFLQAARSDARAAWPTSDPWLLAEFLLASHQVGLEVVAWYLPKWSADDEDLKRLTALSDFSVLGQRFDGLAVDIEWNSDGLSPEVRSLRLIKLSADLRAHVGSDPLGGIVMPPVLTDEINQKFWPGLPWMEIAPFYDVWMPMSYWSFRTEEHADPLYYSGESIRLLRNHLGDPAAAVHGIGGIGAADGTDLPDPGEPLASVDDLEAFVLSLTENDAVGGSIYDWATTGDQARGRLQELFAASFN